MRETRRGSERDSSGKKSPGSRNAQGIHRRPPGGQRNEAFVALGEGISTKEEINTAMKLGTAYPYGPFEWAEKIGVQNIVTLLNKLCKTQYRYKPSELLVQETDKAI